MCILHGSFSFSLHSGRGAKWSPCSWLLFTTVFNHESKPHSSGPRMGWKIWPFPVLGPPFIHIFVTHLCYDSASVSGNGCEVKVNKLGTQGRSPWIKLSPWKWRWPGEHSPQWIVVHQQYAVCWWQETSGCCNQPQELYHSNGQSQGIIWA